MKTNEFTRILLDRGCFLLKHGSRHDIWKNPVTGETEAVPRHGAREIKKVLAMKILRNLSVED